MKKLKILLLFIIILISGCGAKEGAKVLDEALENMNDVKSGIIEVEMDANVDDYPINVKMLTEFTEDGTVHTQEISTILDTSYEIDTYTIPNGDNFNVYYSEDGEEWYYEEISADEYDSDSAISSVGGYAKNYKSAKEVNSDLEGYTKIEVVIDKAEFIKLMSNDDGTVLNITEDVTMYYYIKDGYVTGISYSFVDEAKTLGETSTTYSMNFKISNHNSADKIEIPEDLSKIIEMNS